MCSWAEFLIQKGAKYPSVKVYIHMRIYSQHCDYKPNIENTEDSQCTILTNIQLIFRYLSKNKWNIHAIPMQFYLSLNKW